MGPDPTIHTALSLNRLSPSPLYARWEAWVTEGDYGKSASFLDPGSHVAHYPLTGESPEAPPEMAVTIPERLTTTHV